MKRSPITALLKVGHRSGLGSGSTGLTHRLALTIATMLTVLTGWLFISAHTVFAARDARIAAREPVLIAAGDATTPAMLWVSQGDHFHERQFVIIYLSPLRLESPPPPGLSRWPQPGEVFISPGLLAVDNDAVLRQRYGQFAGQIGPEGLAEPDEWLVYIRPLHDEVFSRYADSPGIAGFGSHTARGSAPFTAMLSGRTYNEMFQLLLLAVALPVLLLLIIAVRSGSEQRDKRLAMLDALGAPRSAKGWVLAGEAARPIVVGAVLATSLALLTTFVDVTVPLVPYGVWSTDLATARPYAFAVGLAGIGSMLIVVVIAQLRRRAQRTTQPRLSSPGFLRVPALLCMIALATTMWSANEAAQRGGVPGYHPLTLVFILAMLCTLTLMPAVVALCVGWLGRIVGSAGKRTGWISALIGGRWLVSRSASLARMCAAAVVGLGVLTIVQVWVSQHADAGQWSSVRQQIAEELITVRTVAAENTADQFISSIGPARTLWIGENSDGRQIMVGQCEALRQIGQIVVCPGTPAAVNGVYGQLTAVGKAMRNGRATILVYGQPMVSTARVPGYRHVGFLVFNADGAAGADAITREAHATLPIPDVSNPGQYGISGLTAQAESYRWLWLFGLIGIMVLIISTALASTDVFLTQARSLGPLGAMNSNRRLYLGIATWNIAIPMTVAGLIGALLAMYLGNLYAKLNANGSVSWEVTVIGFLAVAGLSIAQAILCAEATTRTVRRWHPALD